MDENKTIYSAFIGIDWADKKHDISVVSAAGSSPVHSVIDHSPEALSEWAMKLRQQYPEGQIAICLEQSKGALIYHLLGYDFLTLFPVNPKSLARFREVFTPSGAKSDFSDTDYLRMILVNFHHKLKPWKPDDEQTRMIGLLAEARRKAVNERTRVTNRLRSNLKMYYPQALELVGDSLYSNLALDFLKKWPQLIDLQKARNKTIKQFYIDHNCRSAKCIEERLKQINSTIPLTSDPAVITTSIIMVKMLVAQIVGLNVSIDEFENKLDSFYKKHPDKDIFDSFPGSGQALGPRLVAAWGSDRDRHDSPDSMQKMSGIAPITKASGQSKIVIRRFARPIFMLQTFHEYANCSRQTSAWAHAYYEMLRAKGNQHHTAIRSLAYKWIRIMYRCWKDRTQYNEVKYLQALKKSNSPLRTYL